MAAAAAAECNRICTGTAAAPPIRYRARRTHTGVDLLTDEQRARLAALVQLRRLGRTLTQRPTDVPAYVDRTGTSNGPTEALNGRLEHLHGSALGSRDLTDHIARSLLRTGGSRNGRHPRSR